MAARFRKGDTVMVTAGKYNKQTGKVLEINVAAGRVVVEGVAVQRPHRKANADPKRPEAHIGEKLGHIAISNVMPIDPKTKKPTRVRFQERDGRKVRIAVSGEVIPQAIA